MKPVMMTDSAKVTLEGVPDGAGFRVPPFGEPVLFDRMAGGAFVADGDFRPITLTKLWILPEGTYDLHYLSRCVGRVVRVQLQPLDPNGDECGPDVCWRGDLDRVDVRPLIRPRGWHGWYDANHLRDGLMIRAVVVP